ncbi:MAG: DNA-packaging protein, partial [Candidatus Aminicenantes bacterium]|nr:DNA-packaging protein [Candidatus Aminicenantes bacterium]
MLKQDDFEARHSEIIEARRLECETDGLYFNRFFMKQRLGMKMLVSAHHQVIQDALDRTMLPPDDPNFISRLIINVPPGYTKTEIASIGYMARGIAINPKARFLHLSYSDKLVLQNSSAVRDIVKSDTFQEMWPTTIKSDTDSKKIWHTEGNGGITATAAGGQVTGFRAGHMDDTKFTGALVIDDPVKPDDAHSDTVRKAINNGYNETVASRVAVETVPIIVIMQRLDWNDLSGYLLRGGSGEKWHHLNLPVVINNSETYPDEYTHGIPIKHGLPDGWLWPYKHNEKHEIALKAHRRKYAAQYKQKPLKRDE